MSHSYVHLQGTQVPQISTLENISQTLANQVAGVPLIPKTIQVLPAKSDVRVRSVML